MRPIAAFATVVLTAALAACSGSDGPGGSDAGIPAAPSDVTATPGPGYVTLSWTDNSSDETGFAIYRDVDAGDAALRGQASTKIGEVAADVGGFVDRGVALNIRTSYRVTALNERGESGGAPTPEAVIIEPGVDLMVGTLDRPGDGGVGTVFMLYYALPGALMDDDGIVFDVAIEGPAGWNDDAPFEFTEEAAWFGRQQGYALVPAPWFDAVAGTYEFTVDTGGEVHTASATLANAASQLGPPTGLAVTAASAERVTVTWEDPPGSASTLVSLWREDREEMLRGHRPVTESDTTFEDLTLDDGRYRLEIAPINVDPSSIPVKVEPFGYAQEAITFTIGVGTACSSAPIQDAALAGVIAERLDLTREPTCDDLQDLEILDAARSGTVSLEGLQHASNLTELILNDNDIADLSPLAGVAGLQSLILTNNVVHDLTPLTGLTDLVELWLEGNAVDDISPLADLHALVSLELGGNDVADISALAGMSALEDLGLDGNRLTDLQPLLDAGMGLGDGEYHVSVIQNRLDTGDATSTAMAQIHELLARGVHVEHRPQADATEPPLVEIAGTWSTTLEALESTCDGLPVGTISSADVEFVVEGSAITATSALGAISTGSRNGNTVILTRVDSTEEGQAYEVGSASTFATDAFEGRSIYTFDSGCVITWRFTGSRGSGD